MFEWALLWAHSQARTQAQTQNNMGGRTHDAGHCFWHAGLQQGMLGRWLLKLFELFTGFVVAQPWPAPRSVHLAIPSSPKRGFITTIR